MAIIATTFLGYEVEGGVEKEMRRRLTDVEAKLRSIHRDLGGADDEFVSWCGIKQTHKGYHGGGYHGHGIAIDINYDTNPYIATRTGNTYGGEAGFLDAVARRARAVEVYDRAMAFSGSEGDRADVSIRVNDSIEVTYDRFWDASQRLSFYLSHALQWGDKRVWVDRTPIDNAHELGDGDAAFGLIDAEGELVGYEDAIGFLEGTMSASAWVDAHPTWPWSTTESQYWQLLRDYETVRTPMLQGSASAPVIQRTRNPANGFMDLRRELVVALVRTGGMVWGASDFGAAASGDMMHFDYGEH